MPISAAGNNMASGPAAAGMPFRSREGGFTLVELMVVITIVGLASAAVVLAFPDPRGRVVDQADRFAARVRVAHDAAVMDARPTSVWIASGGYGFDVRANGGWMPVNQKPMLVTQWSGGVRPDLGQTDARVRITFDSTGLADQPVDLKLERGKEAVTVHVGAAGDVHVDA